MKAFFLLALFLLTKQAQSQQPFISSYDWDPAPSAQFGFEKDRIVLKMDKGISWLRDVAVGNGTIEVDIALTGSSAAAGLVFRSNERTKGVEQVYICMQKGKQTDGFHHQLCFGSNFNGQWHTAQQSIPVLTKSDWLHLKVEVHGTVALLYVNGAATPQLTISNWGKGHVVEQIGLWSLGSSSFSQLCIQEKEPPALSAGKK